MSSASQSPRATDTASAVSVPPHHSLRAAVCLAASGGFLDAFTYFGHGHVFANAMTGNVVLMGVSAAARDWDQAFRSLSPILAFLFGVAAAQTFRLPRMIAWFPDPALAALTAEMGFLFIAGWFPKAFPGTPLVLGLSFLAALQSSTFPRVEKWGYNSTMTTGSLRQFGEAAFQSVFVRPNPEAVRRTRVFAFVCLAFLAGAVLGAFCTSELNNAALWVVDVLLFFAWLPLVTSRRSAQTGG